VPDAAFLVADIWQRLPVAAGALAGLLNLFAPRNPAEFARVLAPGGLLLVVIPGPDHLAELRAALPLLGIEADKEAKVQAVFADSFAPQAAQALTYRLALDPAALAELVAMTPSAPHLSDADRQAVDALGAVETTASFRLLPFMRLDQPGVP
jgi:23S rRNA (guanine745-N1)-methyltransferase